jgi:hypothetical protein
MKIVVIISLALLSITLKAQTWVADVSYKYLYAKQWDAMIQTYNFSRPFLKEEQPLLMHGISISNSYFFKSSKKIKHGIHVNYDFFRSSANNTDFKNTLQLHFVRLGYTTLYIWKGNYFIGSVNALGGGLYRKLNDEAVEVDDKRLKALGIGGELSLKIEHAYTISSRIQLMPFLGLNYSPYFFSPNTEAVINQTKSLVSKNWVGIFNAQLGVSFYFGANTEN